MAAATLRPRTSAIQTRTATSPQPLDRFVLPVTLSKLQAQVPLFWKRATALRLKDFPETTSLLTNSDESHLQDLKRQVQVLFDQDQSSQGHGRANGGGSASVSPSVSLPPFVMVLQRTLRGRLKETEEPSVCKYAYMCCHQVLTLFQECFSALAVTNRKLVSLGECHLNSLIEQYDQHHVNVYRQLDLLTKSYLLETDGVRAWWVKEMTAWRESNRLAIDTVTGWMQQLEQYQDAVIAVLSWHGHPDGSVPVVSEEPAVQAAVQALRQNQQETVRLLQLWQHERLPGLDGRDNGHTPHGRDGTSSTNTTSDLSHYIAQQHDERQTRLEAINHLCEEWRRSIAPVLGSLNRCKAVLQTSNDVLFHQKQDTERRLGEARKNLTVLERARDEHFVSAAGDLAMMTSQRLDSANQLLTDLAVQRNAAETIQTQLLTLENEGREVRVMAEKTHVSPPLPATTSSFLEMEQTLFEQARTLRATRRDREQQLSDLHTTRMRQLIEGTVGMHESIVMQLNDELLQIEPEEWRAFADQWEACRPDLIQLETHITQFHIHATTVTDQSLRDEIYALAKGLRNAVAEFEDYARQIRLRAIRNHLSHYWRYCLLLHSRQTLPRVNSS